MVDHSQQRALRKTTIIVIFLLIAVGVGVAGFIIIRDGAAISTSLSSMQQAAQQAGSDVSALRFDALTDDITRGSQSALALERILSESLYFQLPFEQIRAQARAGREVSVHTRRSFDVLLPLAKRLSLIADQVLEAEGSPVVREMTSENRKVALEQLSALYPEYVGARASIALTKERLMNRQFDVLGSQAHNYLDTLVQHIERGERVLNEALPIIEFLPAFLAAGTEKTYLILMQNNTEVRPTGGFIGTYGIVTIRDGSVIRFESDNVYNLDDVSQSSIVPPRPLADYGPVARWYLRDSNWSPDFAQSARDAMAFYRREGGRASLDGVIALTPDVISSLMRVLGPVSVEDLNFHPDQFTDELEFQVERGYERRGIERKDRKDVIRLIANDLFSKLSTLSVYDWEKIASLLEARAADKHVLMYFSDRSMQQMVRNLGMSGEVLGFDGDYLMVVDTNILSLKTDRVMEKHIDYHLQENDDNSLIGTVSLTYRNNGTYSWTTTTYRDYVRILIPDGCTLLGVEGAQNPARLAKKEVRVDVSHERDKLVVGAYFEVQPQKSHTIIFRYRLPKSLSDSIKEKGLYQLFVQKQSGVDIQQLSVNAFFKHAIKRIEPVGFLDSRTSPESVELHANLQTDKRYSFFFK